MNEWQALLTPEIKNFITEHQNADTRELGLKKSPNPDWPYALILDQIKSRQKAAIKTPEWLDREDIILPPPNTLEQASSAATAKYKASLVNGKSFIDLTGGAGIDSWALLESFDSGTIIDTDETAANLIEHNLKILSAKNIQVLNKTAEDFVLNMRHVDLAIIDPQRRNNVRKGLYKLEDCTPNILELLPQIIAKTIILKTSPMLDINLGIEQLGCVKHVHVVEWQGECKEILFILSPNTKTENIPITSVSINDNGSPRHQLTYTREDEQKLSVTISEPLKYLYEPSPAFLKAGGYKSIANKYQLAKLHPHTHLYTSDKLTENFPGRNFEILGTYAPNKKEIPVSKANLSVRNFPQDTATLKKKLKLKDGGNDYLFACTLQDTKTTKNQHKILHCTKSK